MKLLYIVKRPLSPRDADRYGIIRALDLGYRVVVFDISKPSHPELPADQEGVWTHPDLRLDVFDDWSGLRAMRKEFAAADLVMLLNQSFGLSRNTLPVLRLVAASGTPYLVLAPSLYGSAVPKLEEIRPKERLRKFWSRLRMADPLNSLIARIKPSWLGIMPARFIVYNGLASIRPNSLVGSGTISIFAHTHDYDLALTHKPEGDREPIAVFIDQFIGYHPDFKVIKAVKELLPEPYYEALRGLFDRIERELGLEVVIAAHPRADDRIRSNMAFGNRRIVSGKTIELIARARLVLTHTSTAAGLVTLFHTPVMVIATRPLYEVTPIVAMQLDDISTSLGTRLLFIDDPAEVDLSNALTWDEARYTAYGNQFFRHPQAPQGRLWDIVFSAVAAELGESK